MSLHHKTSYGKTAGTEFTNLSFKRAWLSQRKTPTATVKALSVRLISVVNLPLLLLPPLTQTVENQFSSHDATQSSFANIVRASPRTGISSAPKPDDTGWLRTNFPSFFRRAPRLEKPLSSSILTWHSSIASPTCTGETGFIYRNVRLYFHSSIWSVSFSLETGCEDNLAYLRTCTCWFSKINCTGTCRPVINTKFCPVAVINNWKMFGSSEISQQGAKKPDSGSHTVAKWNNHAHLGHRTASDEKKLKINIWDDAFFMRMTQIKSSSSLTSKLLQISLLCCSASSVQNRPKVC